MPNKVKSPLLIPEGRFSMLDYVMVFIEDPKTHDFLASSDLIGRLAPPVIAVDLGKEFENRAKALMETGVKSTLEYPLNLGYSEPLKAHMLLCNAPDRDSVDTLPLKLKWVKAADLLRQNLNLPEPVTTYLGRAASFERTLARR